MLYVVIDFQTKQEQFLLSWWRGQISVDRNRKEWGRLVFKGKSLQGCLNFKDKISVKRTVIQTPCCCFLFPQSKFELHGIFPGAA